MVLRLYVAVTTRYRELTSKDQADRGDSPVPTVIMWIGIAVVAIGLITWVGIYVTGYAQIRSPEPRRSARSSRCPPRSS